MKIYPNILADKHLQFRLGYVLISGTNGKTTTSKLISHILTESGMKVVNNRTGANLMNGIVSEILLSSKVDIGVFEVDENNLPLILNFISLNVLVLLNLSRDQLDRYGEIDIIFEKWLKAVADLDASTELVLDETQDYFKRLAKAFPGEETWFGNDPTYARHTKLVGEFNVKNINAAVYTAQLVGVEEKEILKALRTFDSAYGRGEEVPYDGKNIKIFLAKNPASFNNNLKSIISGEIHGDCLFLILNDRIPDGRDVSWIYDVEPELLRQACAGKKLYVSGDRCWNMAARLKYAGVDIRKEDVFIKLSQALQKFKQEKHKNMIALPNYSAMLDLRKILVGRKIL